MHATMIGMRVGELHHHSFCRPVVTQFISLKTFKCCPSNQGLAPWTSQLRAFHSSPRHLALQVAATASLSDDSDRGERALIVITRALGVDYGRKQVGLAVSTMGLAPRPLPFVNGAKVASEVLDVAKNVVDVAVAEGCDGIIIGLPVTSNGSLRRRASDSQQGRKCRNFAETVSALAMSHAALRVMLVDEGGTTIKAERLLYDSGRRGTAMKSRKDSVAATLILDTYFNGPAGAVCVKPPKLGRGSFGN